MGEHKKQGKTFFVTVDAHMQFAVAPLVDILA